MQLVGKRFSTWFDRIDDEPCVVKSMDVAPEGREPSACFRELIGFHLGTRVGLAIPNTRLIQHERYGRASVQRRIHGAREVTIDEQHAVSTTRAGWRVLMLDLVSRNCDRSPANLLIAGSTIFPIDFNVAFDYRGRPPAYHEFRSAAMKWFGVTSVLRLLNARWEDIRREAEAFASSLSDAYVQFAVAKVPRSFLPDEGARAAVAGVTAHRDALAPMLSRWWDETVRPVQGLLQRGTS